MTALAGIIMPAFPRAERLRADAWAVMRDIVTQRVTSDKAEAPAAAYFSRHRMSTDHGHVVADLQERFELVLEALEREGDWVLNRATPGRIILGELGGIEAGVRQLIRRRPLETQLVRLASGRTLTVPTADEIVRIKAFLIMKRNQMRDYLDLAALSHRFGAPHVGAVLSDIDAFYGDPTHPADQPVQSQLARQLADPDPKDRTRTRDLANYKSLDRRWHDWSNVVAECRALVPHMSG